MSFKRINGYIRSEYTNGRLYHEGDEVVLTLKDDSEVRACILSTFDDSVLFVADGEQDPYYAWCKSSGNDSGVDDKELYNVVQFRPATIQEQFAEADIKDVREMIIEAAESHEGIGTFARYWTAVQLGKADISTIEELFPEWDFKIETLESIVASYDFEGCTLDQHPIGIALLGI